MIQWQEERVSFLPAIKQVRSERRLLGGLEERKEKLAWRVGGGRGGVTGRRETVLFSFFGVGEGEGQANLCCSCSAVHQRKRQSVTSSLISSISSHWFNKCFPGSGFHCQWICVRKNQSHSCLAPFVQAISRCPPFHSSFSGGCLWTHHRVSCWRCPLESQMSKSIIHVFPLC